MAPQMPQRVAQRVALLGLLALVLPLALGQSSNGCIPEGAFDPSINYFSTIFANETFALPIVVGTTITSAYNFTVEYKGYYKVAKDMHLGTAYALYLCGAPPPQLNDNTKVNGFFKIPLTTYGMVTDVPANFLQLLGLVPGLQNVSSDTVVVDACMQRVVQGLAPSPNFGGPRVDAGYGPTFNSPSFSFSASQDQGILNRAEWIKYLALYFNKEDLAQKVFENISAQYACLNGSAPQSEPTPTVAWLLFSGGMWYLSNAKYKMQLVKDGGGVNADTSKTLFNMSIPDDVTKFHELLKSVNVVMDETYLEAGPTAYSIANFTKNAGLSAEQAQPIIDNVWSLYGQYANGNGNPPATAWFETAVSQPQLVLQDVQSILHPSMYPKGFTPTFFYNVNKGKATLITAKDCAAADPTAQVSPTKILKSCVVATAPPSASVGTPGTTNGAAGTPAGTPAGRGASRSLAFSATGLFFWVVVLAGMLLA